MNYTPIPTKKFKEILDLVPVCAVDLLFLNKDRKKTLLFRRKNEPLKGIYFVAGGRLLKNEKLIDGAVRQARRETGLKIDKKRLKFEGVEEEIHKNSTFKNISYHTVAPWYSYILDEEDINLKLDNQHNDYKWFSLDNKEIHPFIKNRIKKILKNYEKGI